MDKYKVIEIDKNKELALRLGGICWHEYSQFDHPTREGWVVYRCVNCGAEHLEKEYPDFATPDGIVLLLKKMREREDWHLFIRKIGEVERVVIEGDGKHTVEGAMIPIAYILDTTGRLRDTALAFLPGKE